MYKKRALRGDAWAYLLSLECCAKAQKNIPAPRMEEQGRVVIVYSYGFSRACENHRR